MVRQYKPELRRLPKDEHIVEPFITSLSAVSETSLDDPEYRRDAVTEYLIPVLPGITDALHRRLTNQHGTNTPNNMGKLFFLPDSTNRALARIHGLHRKDIVEEYIYPQMAQLYASIGEQNGLPLEEQLEIMAIMAGSVITQTQSYRDGNKRIARTVYDFIKQGPSGMSVEGVFSAPNIFSLEPQIERIILERNASRIIQGQHEPGVYDPHATGIADPELRQPMRHAYEVLKDMQDNAVLFDRYSEQGGHQHVISYLSRIHRDLPEGLRAEVVSTLHQKEYGAAALACLYIDRLQEMRLPLGLEEARQLNDIDTELLTMRIMSIMGGIATGAIYGPPAPVGAEESQNTQPVLRF